jgi:hypothetical protein
MAGKGDNPAGRTSTWSRVVISVVAGVALMSVLLTVRGTDIDARNPAAVVVAAWWLSPLAYYWYRVTTVAGSWVLGAGYIGASAWLLLSIYRRESSTAALGFLFAPMLLWPGMLVAVDAERALGRYASLRRQRLGGEMQPSAVRVCAIAPAWWQWLWPTGTALALVSFVLWNRYVALAAVIWSVAGAVVAKVERRQKRA